MLSQLIPKPKPEFADEYEAECNKKNTTFVWYCSLLSFIVFGIHLIHHSRLGQEMFELHMMPYTWVYSLSMLYSLANMWIINLLGQKQQHTKKLIILHHIFPYYMAAVAVMLSLLSGLEGLGITPFAIILMVVCFTLQGRFLLLFGVVITALLGLSVLLISIAAAHVYNPLIAIGFTTSIACIIIANVTEHMRIRQFELVAELSRHNRQLDMLSQQDHLTGVLNKRAIESILDKELARSIRNGQPLSLLIIDIDDFKQVNDNEGHVFGDLVILKVADCLKMHVRNADYVSRVGGDEFIVLLVETNQEQATQIASRMVSEVESIRKHEKKADVSISVGIAVSHDEDSVNLIRNADKALYSAKTLGKNTVCAYSA